MAAIMVKILLTSVLVITTLTAPVHWLTANAITAENPNTIIKTTFVYEGSILFVATALVLVGTFFF